MILLILAALVGRADLLLVPRAQQRAPASTRSRRSTSTCPSSSGTSPANQGISGRLGRAPQPRRSVRCPRRPCRWPSARSTAAHGAGMSVGMARRAPRSTSSSDWAAPRAVTLLARAGHRRPHDAAPCNLVLDLTLVAYVALLARAQRIGAERRRQGALPPVGRPPVPPGRAVARPPAAAFGQLARRPDERAAPWRDPRGPARPSRSAVPSSSDSRRRRSDPRPSST